jgi:hypothetical protein
MAPPAAGFGDVMEALGKERVYRRPRRALDIAPDFE